MHELVQKSDINITTQNGPCHIQLLFGDITMLPLEEKVDIVMVSAFPGDYAASHGTLIGALHYNLGIGVRKLSMDKELDLRKRFNCWMSKPLPVNTPYRRLVCFERQVTKLQVHPAVLVGDVFRGLMPIFNNQDTTMITPFLATGNQNFSRTVMLKSLIDAASNWMKAGLPLRCLKIVLYTRNAEKLSPDEEDVVTLFQKLKNKWERKGATLKVSSLEYDIYLSCSEQDREKVDSIKMILHQQCKDIKIFAEKQRIWVEYAWQEEMFEKMTASKRIVAILTPAYMDSPECIEQFNIALCCTRLQGLTILNPLYVETVPSMPSYMQLVQYLDCRVRQTGESVTGKLQEACEQITGLLRGEFSQTEEERVDTSPQYDIFISYSHRNPSQAEHMLKLLETSSPKTKVFFDRSELKTGKSWQKTLYQSLDSVKCVIALVSSPYLQSPVCQEEYNIALARFLSEEKGLLFVPVCIEDLTEVPRPFAKVKLLDGRGDKFCALSELVCQSILTWLQTGQAGTVFPTKQDVIDIDLVCEEYRRKEVGNRFQISRKSLTKNSFKPNSTVDFPEVGKDVSNICDVYLCYSTDNMRFAAVLYQMITDFVPGVVVSFGTGSPQQRLQKLEIAKHVVTFISPTFLKSLQLMDELHIALCRHRASTKQSLLYSILTSPLDQKPVFLHLIPHSVCVQDQFWDSMGRNMRKLDKMRTVVVNGDLQGSYSCTHEELLALRKASLDLSESLLAERSTMDDDRRGHQMANLINVVDVCDTISGEEITSNVTLEEALWDVDEEIESALVEKNTSELEVTKTTSERVTDHSPVGKAIGPAVGHTHHTEHSTVTTETAPAPGHGHQTDSTPGDSPDISVNNTVTINPIKVDSDLANSCADSDLGGNIHVSNDKNRHIASAENSSAAAKKKSSSCYLL